MLEKKVVGKEDLVGWINGDSQNVVIIPAGETFTVLEQNEYGIIAEWDDPVLPPPQTMAQAAARAAARVIYVGPAEQTYLARVVLPPVTRCT